MINLVGSVLYPVAVLLSWGDALLSLLIRGRDSFFRERLGHYPGKELSVLQDGRVVWVHAASAGEVNAITPLIREMKTSRPSIKVVITTSSRTGRKTAREARIADAVFLAPLDLPHPVRRAFRSFRPVLLAVAETEFWPLLFERSAHNRVPLVLVNGRLSERNFPKYQKARAFFASVLSHVSVFLMQTAQDADRVVGLGAPRKRVQVSGQMKYDVNPPDPDRVEELRRGMGLKKDDVLFTLGSIREGEEDGLFAVLPEVLAISPKVRVLVAPRHLRNVQVYGAKLDGLGLQWTLRSGMGPGRPWKVMVLDTFGELTAAYALSSGVFVGGTLVPIGGHNLVEPALSKVPLCYGPETANVREADEALAASGGGVRMASALELPAVMRKWVEPSASREAGEKAFRSIDSMRGATQRTLRELLRFIPD